MIKLILIAGLLFILGRQGDAQRYYNVHGNVQDSTGAGLSNATVTLISNKDSISVLSQANGDFKFEFKEPISFELLVTMKGYFPYKRQVNLDVDNISIRLKSIILRPDYRELDPVTVSQIRPITISGDTVTYHAAAFSIRDGAEVEVLLKRFPGVEVDQDGNVMVNGKRISKMLVDGKMFFGGDVLTAIRNLPADIVEKVQIIDDYGDKARLIGIKTGQPTKEMNIVLKQDKRTGEFGHLQVGQGNSGKYLTNAFANSFSGERQISINGGVENNTPMGNDTRKHIDLSYANAWSPAWKDEGSLSLSDESPYSNTQMLQESYLGPTQTHQEQNSQSISSSKAASTSNTVTYTPDAFHTFRVSPSLGIQQSGQISTTTFLIQQRDSGFQKNNMGSTFNQASDKTYTVGTDFYCEQLSPRSRSKLSTQLAMHYSYNSQTTDNELKTNTQTSTQEHSSFLHYLVNNTVPNFDLGASINYFTPLGKTGFLELGYGWHINLSRNNKGTREEDSANSKQTPIDSLSQDYLYKSMDHRLHVGYSVLVQKLNLSLGLDILPGYLRGDANTKEGNLQYSYLNWLPSIQASYNLSRTKILSFQYNGTPTLPSIQQVQPITDLSNPLFTVIGNPTLKPAYNQGVSLSYEQSALRPTQFDEFSINIGYNTTQNGILPTIVHPRDSSATMQKLTYVNAGETSSFHSEYHIALPTFFNKRLRVTVNGRVSTNHAISITDNIKYTTINFSHSQNIHFQFIISNVIEMDASWNYSYTHTSYPNAIGQATSNSVMGWSVSNRHYFWHDWVLNYQLYQNFNGIGNRKFQGNPVFMTTSLQRQLLRKNKATITFTVYDLLGTSNSVSQSISATGYTKTKTNLTGRYYMMQFKLKFSRFKK